MHAHVSTATWAGCIMASWRRIRRSLWSTSSEPSSRSSTSSCTSCTPSIRSARVQPNFITVHRVNTCRWNCLPVGCVLQNLVMSQTTTAGLILMCGWLYFAMFLPVGETRLSQLGFTCSVVTVSMYLSPLSTLVWLKRSADKHSTYLRQCSWCTARKKSFIFKLSSLLEPKDR